MTLSVFDLTNSILFVSEGKTEARIYNVSTARSEKMQVGQYGRIISDTNTVNPPQIRTPQIRTPQIRTPSQSECSLKPEIRK
jgi:hypothetical protein